LCRHEDERDVLVAVRIICCVIARHRMDACDLSKSFNNSRFRGLSATITEFCLRSGHDPLPRFGQCGEPIAQGIKSTQLSSGICTSTTFTVCMLFKLTRLGCKAQVWTGSCRLSGSFRWTVMRSSTSRVLLQVEGIINDIRNAVDPYKRDGCTHHSSEFPGFQVSLPFFSVVDCKLVCLCILRLEEH
jgi:hypothetical protein